jgi:hypothetical protein
MVVRYAARKDGAVKLSEKRLSITAIVVSFLSAIAVGFAILRPFHGLEYAGGTLNSSVSRTPEYQKWAETNDCLARIGLGLLVAATVLQIAAIKYDD